MGAPWFGDYLTGDSRPVKEVYGKVGINGSGPGTPFRGFVHDCAVIERIDGTNIHRYAAIALNAKDNSVLKAVIIAMDKLILNHGALAQLRKANAAKAPVR
jgi:hypothetical protein